MSQLGGAPPLNELLDHVESIAPLPQVASRVVQNAEDEHFSAYDLAAIISTDTAKILRLANSAYYGFPRRISTVRDAVVVIGFRAVRATAIAAAVVDLFRNTDGTRFDADLFWAHSVACASVAEAVANATPRAQPDEAFTAGILHDIGRLVLAQYVQESFNRALDIALAGSTPLEAAEKDVLGYDHAELGSGLARRWNFPADICAAIADHHDLQISQDEAPLTYVLARANHFCRCEGLWCGLDSEDGRRAYGSGADADPRVVAIVASKLGGVAGLESRVCDFLSSSSDREQRWYTPLEGPLETDSVSAGPDPERDAVA